MAGKLRPTVPRKKPPESHQTSLWSADGRAARTSVVANWPDPSSLPHNEGESSVAGVIDPDLRRSGDVLLVTGYAALDRVIVFLASRKSAPVGKVRILFGNEPYPSRRDAVGVGRRRLSDEVRDYWLRRGVSVSLSGRIIEAREVLVSGSCEVRVAAGPRPLHAKLYVTPEVATLGSSNFTDRGFRGQSEANARFLKGDPKFDGTVALAVGFWASGSDYLRDLVALLDRLLRQVTWQEALARACAEILEGEWARRYVPPDEIDRLERPLWPHQLQGISQALYAMIHQGSVLVADATGSGKTRMGAWLLRAAFDRQVRSGNGRRTEPLLVSPPPIVESWLNNLEEAGLTWTVESHGPLSNPSARAHARLTRVLEGTELLAIDEAHNFVNPSGRTLRVLSHYADNVVLFTATPINKGAADLLAMVELLGADNFTDDTLDRIQSLSRIRRSGPNHGQEAVVEIKRELQRFLVRRTRSELNRIADASPDRYRLPSGRRARYPGHIARYYEVAASDEDLRAAAQIDELATQLIGVARVGTELRLPLALHIEGMSEEQYVRRLVSSAKALARHVLLECLRSSRAALYEHVHGTAAAIREVCPPGFDAKKQSTGDTIGTLEELGGTVPKWSFRELRKDGVERWLWDEGEHREACEHDAALYRRIGELAAKMSTFRDEAKIDRLVRMRRDRGQVIAFDSHILSLLVFEDTLLRRGEPARVFVGEGGAAAKRAAASALSADGDGEPIIALCSDALSEGMNLQGASCVVHLDTPTVIRTAEQRAGRVDRMDSAHDDIEIWWPRDPPGFAPRRTDLLRERHGVVQELIGANLTMPGDGDVVEFIAERARVGREEEELREEDPRSLLDAFRPVRELLGQGGLITDDEYERMQTSQVHVTACVGAVESRRPWMFAAIGGAEREAPRWVFLDGPGAAPVGDLAGIERALRDRLGPDTMPHAIDTRATDVIDAHLGRLRAVERDLLPVRRQRALELAGRVLEDWKRTAWEHNDRERQELIRDLSDMLRPPSGDDPYCDPRAVADAWLRVFRPVQQAELRNRRGKRRRIWRLGDLYEPLVREPVSTEVLTRAFDGIPLLQSIAERIVAMIVGVTEEG